LVKTNQIADLPPELLDYVQTFRV